MTSPSAPAAMFPPPLCPPCPYTVLCSTPPSFPAPFQAFVHPVVPTVSPSMKQGAGKLTMSVRKAKAASWKHPFACGKVAWVAPDWDRCADACPQGACRSWAVSGRPERRWVDEDDFSDDGDEPANVMEVADQLLSAKKAVEAIPPPPVLEVGGSHPRATHDGDPGALALLARRTA